MICSWHAAPAKGSADPYQEKASFGLAFPASAATDGTLGESQKYIDLGLSGPKKKCLPTRMDQVGRLLTMKSRKADVYFLPDAKRTHAPSTVVPLHSVQPWKTPNVRCHLLIHNSNLAGVSTHVGAWQNWTIQSLRPNILVSIYVFHVFVKPKRIMVCWYDQPM